MRRFVPSATMLSMVVYGAGGVAFAGANLLLARALSVEQYAHLTLLVAVLILGYHLAPCGLDLLVNRGRVATGRPLLERSAALAAGVAVAFAAGSFMAYGFSPATTALLGVATLAGGVKLVAAARFQSEQRFGISLALILSPNALLLLGAVATLALDLRSAAPTFMILVAGLVLGAVVGWALVLREPRDDTRPSHVPWSETLALAGVSAAGMLFIQLERLVIPYVLTVEDLALFGVLAAIVGSLFRLLQTGVGYSLLPRLRAAATVVARRRLVIHELWFAVIVAGGGAVAILVLTPLLERWFLAGKYHLSMTLIAAALFSGIAKIAHAFAKATATALATPRELAIVNGAGWVSAVLAIGGAIVGARWGLVGVIYGVGAGWLAWAVTALAVVLHHLQLPEDVPAARGSLAK